MKYALLCQQLADSAGRYAVFASEILGRVPALRARMDPRRPGYDSLTDPTRASRLVAFGFIVHGLERFSKTGALEGGSRGVTSNCVCPAYVRTPLVEKQIGD